MLIFFGWMRSRIYANWRPEISTSCVICPGRKQFGAENSHDAIQNKHFSAINFSNQVNVFNEISCCKIPCDVQKDQKGINLNKFGVSALLKAQSEEHLRCCMQRFYIFYTISSALHHRPSPEHISKAAFFQATGLGRELGRFFYWSNSVNDLKMIDGVSPIQNTRKLRETPTYTFGALMAITLVGFPFNPSAANCFV